MRTCYTEQRQGFSVLDPGVSRSSELRLYALYLVLSKSARNWILNLGPIAPEGGRSEGSYSSSSASDRTVPDGIVYPILPEDCTIRITHLKPWPARPPARPSAQPWHHSETNKGAGPMFLLTVENHDPQSDAAKKREIWPSLNSIEQSAELARQRNVKLNPRLAGSCGVPFCARTLPSSGTVRCWARAARDMEPAACPRGARAQAPFAIGKGRHK